MDRALPYTCVRQLRQVVSALFLGTVGEIVSSATHAEKTPKNRPADIPLLMEIASFSHRPSIVIERRFDGPKTVVYI